MDNAIDAVAIGRAPQRMYRPAQAGIFVAFEMIGAFGVAQLFISMLIHSYERAKIQLYSDDGGVKAKRSAGGGGVDQTRTLSLGKLEARMPSAGSSVVKPGDRSSEEPNSNQEEGPERSGRNRRVSALGKEDEAKMALATQQRSSWRTRPQNRRNTPTGANTAAKAATTAPAFARDNSFQRSDLDASDLILEECVLDLSPSAVVEAATPGACEHTASSHSA